GHEGVERVAIQATGGLMTADSAQPRPGGQAGVCVLQDGCDVAAELHRPVGGGHGEEVDVVVVEAGKEGTSTGVEHLLPLLGLQGACHFGNGVAAHAHVHPTSLDVGLAHEEPAHSSANTTSLCSPRAGPGAGGAGTRGSAATMPGGAGSVGPVNWAATPARETSRSTRSPCSRADRHA